MKTIIETKRMSATKLREMCIEMDWYTCGDNDEFDALMAKTGDWNKNITPSDLYDMAADIIAHSSDKALDGMEITDVMFYLGRIVYTFYSIAE